MDTSEELMFDFAAEETETLGPDHFSSPPRDNERQTMARENQDAPVLHSPTATNPRKRPLLDLESLTALSFQFGSSTDASDATDSNDASSLDLASAGSALAAEIVSRSQSGTATPTLSTSGSLEASLLDEGSTSAPSIPDLFPASSEATEVSSHMQNLLQTPRMEKPELKRRRTAPPAGFSSPLDAMSFIQSSEPSSAGSSNQSMSSSPENMILATPMASSSSCSSLSSAASLTNMSSASSSGGNSMGNFALVSPETPSGDGGMEKKTPEKKGNGKDGMEVWPEEVEEAFFEALRRIPKLGRRKVMVNGKPCGRNELIADYIRRKTGKLRSRKQVSSHIQVLKNMKRNDPEFMKLVSEPMDGEDVFSPLAQASYFLPSQRPSLLPTPVALQYGDGLHSPFTPTFLSRSISCGPTPMLGPSGNHDSPLPSPYFISSPMSATSSITSAMKDLHFPIPPSIEISRSPQATCPIAPANLCLWADKSDGDAMHVFAKLAKNDKAGLGNSQPTGNVYLEELPMAEVRYPKLSEMHESLPCQFLHVKLNLALPEAESGISVDGLHTQLTLTSLQDLSLTSVTTIYSFGTQVLSLEEQLPSPSRLTPSSRGAVHPTTSGLVMSASPASSPISPVGPGSNNTSPNALRHKYSYSAPFASDFWSIFFRGSVDASNSMAAPRFAKDLHERSELAAAIAGLSVVQEFVVRADDSAYPSLVPDASASKISPGSALGDVVLVIIYDLEACETDSPLAGSAKVSFLSMRRPVFPVSAGALARMQSLAAHPTGTSAARVPSPLSNVSNLPPIPGPSRPSNANNAIVPVVSNHPTLSRPRSMSKPALTLNIPPPNAYLSNSNSSPGSEPPPITPWPQIVHTPAVPPAVQAPSSPTLRNRLGQIWAATSADWAMTSPALMVPQEQGGFSGPNEALDYFQHLMNNPGMTLSNSY